MAKDTRLGPLVYDMRLKRPACVLLQAIYGGSSALAQRFDSHTWLLSPTPDMRLYTFRNQEEFREAVRLTEEHFAKQKRK